MSRFKRQRLEKDIEADCRKIIIRIGGRLDKSILLGAPGFPDRIMTLPRFKFGAYVEFKRPGNKPTKLQEYWIAQLRTSGFRAEWFYSVEAFLQWLRSEGIAV